MTNKRLISNLHKQHMQFNIKKKSPSPIKEVGRRLEQIILQKWHTDGQQAHEKMLNIASY